MTNNTISQDFTDIKSLLNSNMEISEKKTLLTEFLQRVLSNLIGVPDEGKFDINETLFDQGMDSLLSVQLKILLEKQIGVSMSTKFIYQYPSIDELAGYLAQEC